MSNEVMSLVEILQWFQLKNWVDIDIIVLVKNQANVQTGRTVHQIPCRAAMNSVEWNPKYNLLAYAGDDKNKYQADEGSLLLL